MKKSKLTITVKFWFKSEGFIQFKLTIGMYSTIQIDAILARCFDVYKDCTDAETLEKSKEEYIMELVDTPIDDPVWHSLKKCPLIQVKPWRCCLFLVRP